MHTPGVDPYSYLAEVSRVMDTLTQRDQIETVLDKDKLIAARVKADLQGNATPEPDA